MKRFLASLLILMAMGPAVFGHDPDSMERSLRHYQAIVNDYEMKSPGVAYPTRLAAESKVLMLRRSIAIRQRSFSSGSSSRPSSSGGKSFSSGGSKPATPSGSKPAPGGKTFSSGPKPAPGGKSSHSPAPSAGGKGAPSNKPGKTSFDSMAGKEQMKAESRKMYQQGAAPKAEYRTGSGTTVKLDPRDKKIERLRGQLDQQKWVNRQMRQEQFYGTYYHRPVVVYNDPYPSFFWWWLLDRSLEERAMWAYNHRYDMDQARYQALLARDSQMESRIRQLEMRGTPRDTTYTPKGMETDLMYSNDYVDAVYNPHPTSSQSSPALGWLCCIFVILLFVGVIVYLVFFYRGF